MAAQEVPASTRLPAADYAAAPRLKSWQSVVLEFCRRRTLGAAGGQVRSSVPGPRPLPAGAGELAPSSPVAIAASAVAAFALLWLVGAGWSRWAFGDLVAAAAAAPAFGIATVTMSALLLERLGVPFDGRWGPVLASAVAGLGGYTLLVVQRKPAQHPVAQIDEAPDHEHEHGGRQDPVPDP